MIERKAFVLTSQWSDSDRYPLQYYCTSDSGTIVLKFDTESFVFFAETEKLKNNYQSKFSKKDLTLKAFDGTQVSAIYCQKSSDFFNLKKELSNSGIRTFENDIWPTDRFLMERFIYGAISIKGESVKDEDSEVFINPKVVAATYEPVFTICSLDIETGVDGSLYSIGLHISGQKEKSIVYMLSHEDRVESNELEFFSNEKKLLVKFMHDFYIINPDIIIGWHVIGFDLKFLENKCFSLGMKLNISRDKSEIRIDEKKGSGFFANITGRVVVDGPPAFRSAFYQFKNFKLETVASSLLGVGKDIASDGGKVSEIERRFKEDKIALAKYNLLDCKLVTNVFNKVELIQFLVARVKVSGLLIDRQGISAAALDHVLLPKLHRKGFVAPNSSELERDENSSGGMVIEPEVGLHENVAVFDFKSLYPSVIRTFFIDPYSRVRQNSNPVLTPAGISFSSSEHLLPDIIKGLLGEREQAKIDSNHSLNMAIKILMNSFYGLMGSFRCRFYHADLPRAITETGHWLLKQSIDFFENLNLKVLYGDTDSLFIQLPSGDESFATDLCVKANDFLIRLVKEEFRVDSHLELEFEKIYSKIFFSTVRGSEAGAKKKYVGLYKGELNFTGMEYVRSDWTDLAKKFQYDLFKNYFVGESVEEYVKGFVVSLNNGDMDNLLFITKKLSKAPEDYVKNIPPHVKAALLIDHRGPYRLKEVTYSQTTSGPLPKGMESDNFDYSYYIDKQIKPLADQVLLTMGTSFESISLGDQLTLF